MSMDAKVSEINDKIKAAQEEFTKNNEYVEKLNSAANKIAHDIKVSQERNTLLHGAIQAYMDALKVFNKEMDVNG